MTPTYGASIRPARISSTSTQPDVKKTSAPAIGQGRVFVRSNDGRVTAFVAATGERRWFWNHDLPSLTARGNDSLTLGPGVVFVGNDDGNARQSAEQGNGVDAQPAPARPVEMPSLRLGILTHAGRLAGMY